jgi:3-deoxy-manno-octulosonate cytidylyltransferase (CMP-KDO synthetase)
MRTLIVIPARLAATRLPGKPLRDLAGKPLIVRVWERVSAMKIGDRCVVATDDAAIAAAVESAGAEYVMTSPTCESGTDRVAEVAEQSKFAGYDLIVNVQGDEPLIGRKAIAAAIQAASHHGAGTTAVRAGPHILTDPNVVKVVTTDDGRALYFSRAPIPFSRDQNGRHAQVLQHVGVYAYSRAALARWVALPPHPLEMTERLEQLRPLAAGMTVGVTMADASPGRGIDTEEDLAYANEHWTELTADHDT